jgi:hypothetical protein
VDYLKRLLARAGAEIWSQRARDAGLARSIRGGNALVGEVRNQLCESSVQPATQEQTARRSEFQDDFMKSKTAPGSWLGSRVAPHLGQV